MRSWVMLSLAAILLWGQAPPAPPAPAPVIAPATTPAAPATSEAKPATTPPADAKPPDEAKPAPPTPREQVTTIAGVSRAVGLSELGGGKLTFDDQQTLPLEQFWQLAFPALSTKALPWRLTGPGLFWRAKTLSYADGQFKLTRDGGLAWTVPRTALANLRHGPGTEEGDAAFAAASAANAPGDRLLALSPKGSVLTLAGQLGSLSGDKLGFTYQGELRNLALDKVIGLLLPTPLPTPPAAWRLVLHDGSWVEASEVTLKAGKLHLTSMLGPMTLPVAEVATLHYRNPRLRPLAEMTPSQATASPIAGAALAWQRDRNAFKQPLMVGSTSYASGLGLKGPCVLSWAIPAKAEAFLAVAGLDPQLARVGDCVLVLSLDGQEKLRQRLTPSSKPLNLNLPVTGARTLTLTLEAGENFDLGDFVNLGAARFILTP